MSLPTTQRECRKPALSKRSPTRNSLIALEAVNDAEALVIATEWNEFANVDLAVVKEKMRTPIVFDGRNLLDPETMGRLGFHYYSMDAPA
jgi:Predicted UDP-glucose 6-dehydrogenase